MFMSCQPHPERREVSLPTGGCPAGAQCVCATGSVAWQAGSRRKRLSLNSPTTALYHRPYIAAGTPAVSRLFLLHGESPSPKSLSTCRHAPAAFFASVQRRARRSLLMQRATEAQTARCVQQCLFDPAPRYIAGGGAATSCQTAAQLAIEAQFMIEGAVCSPGSAVERCGTQRNAAPLFPPRYPRPATYSSFSPTPLCHVLQAGACFVPSPPAGVSRVAACSCRALARHPRRRRVLPLRSAARAEACRREAPWICLLDGEAIRLQDINRQRRLASR